MKNAVFKNLQEINDVYFISELIKKLNKNYTLYYNQKINRYEIHDTQKTPSLIITYYSYPDQKLIEKLILTKPENSKKIFDQIEKHNEQLRIKNERENISKANDYLNEILHYGQSKVDFNISKEQIKKIINKWGRLWQKIF